MKQQVVSKWTVSYGFVINVIFIGFVLNGKWLPDFIERLKASA